MWGNVAWGTTSWAGSLETSSPTTYTITPSGGVLFSGLGTQINSLVIIPTGGVTFSGGGVTIYTKIIDPGSGVTFGGTGSMTSNTVVVIGTTGERTKVGAGT